MNVIDIIIYGWLAIVIIIFILVMILGIGEIIYDKRGKYVKFYHDKNNCHRIDWNSPLQFYEKDGGKFPYHTCRYCEKRYFGDPFGTFTLEDRLKEKD